MFVPRYGHIRTSKFGVGLSERQSNFTLFVSKTGGSDYVWMGLFVSIYGSYSLNLLHFLNEVPHRRHDCSTSMTPSSHNNEEQIKIIISLTYNNKETK